MKTMCRLLPAGLLCALWTFVLAASSYAATANIVVSPGTTYYIDNVSATVTCDQLAGMEVTAYFSDSSWETSFWQATGFQAGGVFGSNWSILASGDSFTTWTLTNDVQASLAIDRIILDGFSGKTVFDINSGNEGTPNSDWGWDFSIISASDPFLTMTATYRDQVAITGNSPVGDEYRYLEMDFTATSGAFAPNSVLEFGIDTDSFSAVPEPASLLLLGSGLAGMMGLKRRFRK